MKNGKNYSKKFKQKALELSNVRSIVQEVAGELGIRAELIYRRRREFNNDPSLSFSGNGNKQLSPEEKDQELDWLQFLDENGMIAKREKITSYPTNFLLNEKGEVIGKNISLKELERLLEKNKNPSLN